MRPSLSPSPMDSRRRLHQGTCCTIARCWRNTGDHHGSTQEGREKEDSAPQGSARLPQTDTPATLQLLLGILALTCASVVALLGRRAPRLA